jgi:hypothetical protein
MKGELKRRQTDREAVTHLLHIFEKSRICFINSHTITSSDDQRVRDSGVRPRLHLT